MISAAAEQLPATRITAVTVLTSMGAPALADLGWGHHHTVVELVVHLATQAVAAGARAIVCSPQEIQAVRQAVGPDIHLLTPGIRPAGPTARRDSTQGVAVSPADDQERVATPAQALQAGADLLVIGRPITAAADPAAAVAAMGFPL